jgi:methyl-accepting chemotaxis protein
VKLNNLTIAPKLGILVGVTLLGLCVSGAIAGYLMKQEMLNARIDETKTIVEIVRNMAGALQREVAAGKLTKEAALAELRLLGNAMTYDNGSGYMYGFTYEGITQLSPDPKQIGTNRMDLVVNGRKLQQEIMDGVKANGEVLLNYEYMKPGQETPVRKIGYGVAVPGFDMVIARAPISTISMPNCGRSSGCLASPFSASAWFRASSPGSSAAASATRSICSAVV